MLGADVDHDVETRVLLLAPVVEDARLCQRILTDLGVPWSACEDGDHLAREIVAGAGAVLVSGEALDGEGGAVLESALKAQPSWSDLPVIALGEPGETYGGALRGDETWNNLLLVERPVSDPVLQSAVRVALRFRTGQYAARQRSLLQREADSRQEAAEAEFQATFELSGVGQAQADATSGRFVRVNRAFCELTGYREDELLGMTFRDLTHPEDRDRDAQAIQEVLDARAGSWSSEKRYVRKDGQLRWVHVTGTVLRDADGRPLRTMGVIVDLSETRRVGEALARSQAEFQAMFDALLEAVVMADAQRRIIMVNPAFTTLFGYEPDEVLGRTTEFLYADPADYEAQGRARYGADAVAPSEPYEIRYRRKDGTVFVAEAGGAHVRDKQDRLIGFVSLHRDVTERRAAEEEIARRERDYRTLVENLPGLVYRVHLHRNGETHFFNDLVEGMTGYRGHELTRGDVCSIDPLILEADRQRVTDIVGRAVAENRPFDVTYRIRAKDGELRQFVERGRPVVGDDGEPAFIDGVIFDVTTRRRAEEALEESEERFRQLAENVEEVFFLVTPDWNEVLYISPAYEKVWGRSCSSLYESPRSWMDAVVPEDRARAEASVAQGISGDLPKVYPEYRVSMPDGTRRWIEARAWPIFDEHGRVYRVAGIATDTTERKESQEALRRSRDDLQLIHDSTSDGLLIGDLETRRFVAANPAICRMLGYTEDELLSMTIPDLHPPEARSDMVRAFEQAPHTGERLIEAIPVVAKDGTLLRMDLSGRPIIYKGRPCVIGFFHDVTERIRMEEELRQAKAVAEAASEAKSRFLANTSHELRTPMSAILGMTTLAMEEELSPTVRDYLETARDAGTTLLSLLDDVLDVSRIEAGRLELEERPFRLRPTVEEVIKTLGPKAYEKGLELISEWPVVSPEVVIGDPSRLRQILFNLIGNAIKFSRAGEVVVRKEVVALHDNEVVIGFSVSDTGIGIAAEDQKRIFEPFLQADASTTREHEGTGLGLAITAGLVERMGGKIHVESRPGEATTFRFTLRLRTPAPPSDEGGRPAITHEAMHDVRALMVTASEPLRRSMEKTLSAWTMRLESAATGSDALERLRKASEAGEPFRVLFAERRGPKIDGLALAREIASDRTLAEAVVLMVTPQERIRGPVGCEEVGAICLEKPVLYSSLENVVLRALGLAVAERGAGRDGLIPLGIGERKLKILVAEDTPAGQKFVDHLLTRRGHRVEVAEDGKRAVELARQGIYDLVLMDVQMPRMDGIDATRAIRALEDPAKARVPIVALTAHALKGEAERCLAAGMNAFLSKPVNGKRLIELVERVAGEGGEGAELQSSSAEPLHSLSSASGLHSPFPPAEVLAAPEEARGTPGDVLAGASAAFDPKEALQVCFGDARIFRDLAEHFFEERDQLLAAMRQSVAEADAPGLGAQAHRLKNTVLFLAAGPAARATEWVGEIADAGDLRAAPEALDRLAAHLRTLGDELTEYLAKN